MFWYKKQGEIERPETRHGKSVCAASLAWYLHSPNKDENLHCYCLNWDDNLYQVRPKKKTAGVDESKGGEAEEGDEEEDEDGDALWAELEGEIAGELDIEIRGEDDLGLDALMGFDFVEPDDACWNDIWEEEEPWVDDE